MDILACSAIDGFCVALLFFRGVGDGDLCIQECREEGQNGRERVSGPAEEAIRDER